jgi:hypothetical protein
MQTLCLTMTSRIPGFIERLPSYPLIHRAGLANCPCVYFAIADGAVWYVGQTSMLQARWQSSSYPFYQLCEFPDAVICWFLCNNKKLRLCLERALISHLNPTLNGNGLSTEKTRLTVSLPPKVFLRLQQQAKALGLPPEVWAATILIQEADAGELKKEFSEAYAYRRVSGLDW